MTRSHVAITVRFAATAFAFLLGIFGFATVYTEVYGHPHSLATNALNAMQLIIGRLPADLNGVPLPWSLAIACWALPLLTCWTTLALAWRQVRNPVKLRWMTRRGDHLVIAGDRDLAARVVSGERAHGRPVLLWSDDPAADWIDRLADEGVVHVPTGDGQSGAATLGLDRADAVLLIGPDDTRNMMLAGAVMAEARDKRPPGDPLPVVACINDIDLRHSVEARYAREADRRSARLRVVSLPDVAARALFLDQPLDRFQPIGAPDRLVLSFGFGAAIERYVLRLLAGGHYRDGRAPKIVVLDRDAAAKEAVFRARRPGADTLSPLLFERAAVDQPALLATLLADVIARHGEPSAILIDSGDDARALASGYAVENWYISADRPAPPIHVRTAPVADDQLGCSLHTFGSSTLLANAGPLLQDGHDALARAIHETYLDGQLDSGTPIGTRESMREWDDLAETVRDDNRLVADCYQLKLRDIGARLGPVSERGFRFEPDELEELARAEHDRWTAAKLIDGWSYGAERDDDRRTHPDIIPYDDLSEPVRELDRDQIRLMTRLLPLSGHTPLRALTVSVMAGSGSVTLEEATARLAELYPDRAPVLLGCPHAPSVGSLLVAAGGAGWLVQLVLRQHPQRLLDTLDSSKRTAMRRMIRCADTIFVSPEDWSEPDTAGWTASRAELAMTVDDRGRVAAPWLS